MRRFDLAGEIGRIDREDVVPGCRRGGRSVGVWPFAADVFPFARDRHGDYERAVADGDGWGTD